MKRRKNPLHYFLSKVLKEIRQLYLMKDISARLESKVQCLAEKANLHVSTIYPIRIAQLSFDCFAVFVGNKLFYCLIMYESIEGDSYLSAVIYDKEQSLLKRVGRGCSIWNDEKTIRLDDISLNESAKFILDNVFQHIEFQLKATTVTEGAV